MMEPSQTAGLHLDDLRTRVPSRNADGRSRPTYIQVPNVVIGRGYEFGTGALLLFVLSRTRTGGTAACQTRSRPHFYAMGVDQPCNDVYGCDWARGRERGRGVKTLVSRSFSVEGGRSVTC
jgi:hypothetical protein